MDLLPMGTVWMVMMCAELLYSFIRFWVLKIKPNVQYADQLCNSPLLCVHICVSVYMGTCMCAHVYVCS